MNDLKAIDLHIHTNLSDGTDTPEELLTRVRQVGLDLFSVTDIDAVGAYKSLRSIMTENDPVLIPGVEFSCKDEEGQYHILGYGFDTDAEPMRGLLESVHELRISKVKDSLDFLKKECGVRFPTEEYANLYALENPGKQHLANLLVKYGFTNTVEQAFVQYIKKIRYQRDYLRPEETIRAIRESGGIPVLAHPAFGRGDQLISGKALDRRIKRLMEFSLQGLEAYYSGFSDKLRNETLVLAERYDLYVTAGSNYHGTNKMALLGNTGLEEPEKAPEGFRRFLEAVRPG